jgi:hypothetical protein
LAARERSRLSEFLRKNVFRLARLRGKANSFGRNLEEAYVALKERFRKECLRSKGSRRFETFDRAGGL